jgi:hypothetical protein
MPNSDKALIRKRHNITLSDSAWQYLDNLKKTHPMIIKSRCGAIEFLIDFYEFSLRYEKCAKIERGQNEHLDDIR